MRIKADLHIHSHFSRATSPKLTPPYLERWARIKGIDLLGTGDCTHPVWLRELRDQLDDAEEGFFTLKKRVRDEFDAGTALAEWLPAANHTGAALPRFVLTGEISTIYKQDGRTRKVHHVVLLPDFQAAADFQTAIESRQGNIRSDGRPILGITSHDLLALLLDTDDRAMLVPAHIWTPWFSALGANSGFDSIDECYGDLAGHIHAIETGLSSNPPMNWAVSGLDRFAIISNSDAHSPEKLAREATIIEMDRSYPALIHALDGTGIIETIEFFPQEGKYHYDGHRKCGVSLKPEEAAHAGRLCPVCGKALTRGVMGRVLELADRPVDETASCPGIQSRNQRPYQSFIPLKELLGELLGTGSASKKVESAYTSLINTIGSELSILMEYSLTDLENISCPGISGELLACAVDRMRQGQVFIQPGYDGEFGIIRAFPRLPTGKALLTPLDFSVSSTDSALDFFSTDSDSIEPVTIPKRQGTCSENKGTVPEDQGTCSENKGTVPERQGTCSKSKGTVPEGQGTCSKSKRIDSTDPVIEPVEMILPSNLHPDQEKIVQYDGHYALIVAGPGTGKTAVLAARIVRQGADRGSILALTFTVKAALELKERIAARTGDDCTGITTGTFHSLCASILRDHLPPFDILGDSDRTILLEEVIKGAKGRIKGPGLGVYIESRKRFVLRPGESAPPVFPNVAADFDIPDQKAEAERLYADYRDRLAARSALDFDDLVAETVRLLMAEPAILSQYQERFRFIFVDEYQDINFAQYALLRLLVRDSLWTIGDPNQAIYAFRGSDKRFMDRFLLDYPDAARFHLSQSFRCASAILDAAGQLMDTRLAGTQAPATLYRTEYPTGKAEAEGIARRIAFLIGGTSFFAFDSNVVNSSTVPDQPLASLDACAVLLRTMALAPAITKALRDHGIPYTVAGEKPWWEPALPLLNAVDRSSDLTPSQAVQRAWEQFPAQKQIHAALIGRILELAAFYDNLTAFLDALTLSDPQEAVGLNGVRIMSIHASKGLEFDHVFVAGVEEGLLPFTLYKDPDDSDQSIEEERRLLYVAMTRAKTGLYLSWARSRDFHTRRLEHQPSRFLKVLEAMIPLHTEDLYKIKPHDPQLQLF
ncbi:ATP-dependent DNA helicase UvrD [Spirochaetia bacterium]|nr:ATP-dependent DNA helicase UvrD [Spirochaetia bacterium]GHU29554.1 ATP-dependent DNA helicase UvrD [Spirochaetia bacterium]